MFIFNSGHQHRSQFLIGVLVFNGQQQVYKHRDTSVGVHAELSKVMAALA